jgi:hypothetical protein
LIVKAPYWIENVDPSDAPSGATEPVKSNVIGSGATEAQYRTNRTSFGLLRMGPDLWNRNRQYHDGRSPVGGHRFASR